MRLHRWKYTTTLQHALQSMHSSLSTKRRSAHIFDIYQA